MLLSRFWYAVLGLALGAAIFVLFLAQSMYNRAGARAMGEGLSSDSQFVSWYLKDDARMRSGHLVKFALNADIAKSLHEASQSETTLKSNLRDKVSAALKKVNATIPADQAFDAVFAIDQHGRVVAHLGYEQATGMDDFELGGYPVVADALHGYIRDDTLVWGRLYRVVARPVEFEVGAMPAGAIVGARIVDDRFARELSSRTGAAVAFYIDTQRVASGAPEGFDRANLDQVSSDIGNLGEDADYEEKGRSQVREIGRGLGVQYTRMPGEAYALGAGYAVARFPNHVDSPLGFFQKADDKDKEQANVLLAAGAVILALLLGVLFTLLEHTKPLVTFKQEAQKLAEGKSDQLLPSKFRGVYRKIASDLNDGIDKLVARGGGSSRRAADLESVLGELPSAPQMSAFSVPGGDAAPPSSGMGAPGPKMPSPPQRGPLPAPPGGMPAPPPRAGAVAASPAPSAPADDEAEWKQVFEQFVATKQQCGESTDGVTYDKFRKTLVKNQLALSSEHGAASVKFSVYVKDGKAALKANPVR